MSADKKQLERLEKDLRNGQADVTKLAMKSNLIIGVVTSAVFFVVSKRCVGAWAVGDYYRAGRRRST